MMKNFFFTPFLILLLTSSCGFKVLNLSEINNFYVKEVKTEGEKRIGNQIKKKILLTFNENQKNEISIKLKTTKNKSINEKNINNEITKFKIIIMSNLEITSKNTESIEKITLSNSGIYEVGSKHTQTLTNERSLIKSLTESHIDEIIEELILKSSDK